MAIMVFTMANMVCTTWLQFFATYRKDWGVVVWQKKQYIWYNDIEDGFNLSEFEKVGEIEKYNCQDDEISWAVTKLYNSAK